MGIASMFADSSSRVTVQIDAPAQKKPLNAPAKVQTIAAPTPEQFVGSVEVVTSGREEAAPAKQVKSPASRYSTFQVIPHAETKNDNIDLLADFLAGSYRELYQRFESGRIADPDRLFFETVISPDAYRTYITTNTPLTTMAKQQVEQIWRHVTTQDVEEDPLAGIDLAASACYDLRLRGPYFLSLVTDRRLQEKPLGELLQVSRRMDKGDAVYVQFGFQAAEESWHKGIEGGFAQRGQRARFVKRPPKWWNKGDRYSDATGTKSGHHGFDVVLRVIVTSPDDRRRAMLVRGVTSALKQLDHDNELQARPVRRWWVKAWLKRAQRRHIAVPFRTKKRQILTGPEIAHLVKLPQRTLQQEFPHLVHNISKQEVSLPDELFLDGPRIVIGTVTEKGTTRTASFPLEAPSTDPKYVKDAYCLPEFVFGEMGSGKTGEAIHRAHSAICNGQTAFFFDSADGAACRELHDSLPADYPEEKIIHIDLSNKAWPIALRWAFNPSVGAGDDAELKAEEAREAGRIFLRQFIGGMAATEFTDRMERYLASAARAAGAAPLDLELALTSPAYREELLARAEVAAQLDVAADLQALQEKSRRGSENSTVDGIISRLRMLSSSKFRENLFFQEPSEELDFRRFADTPEGGYGCCVTIYCDKNSHGADGQEAILTFMLAKVLLEGAYSRVDIAPAARKPFVVILDEPHRFIKGEMATKLGEDAAVELRKYRCKLVMMGHSRAQLGKLWDSFASGGIQVTMYKSKDVQAFKDMSAVIAPLDPERAWASLGQHEAVVTRKLPSKTEVSFICKMAAPPAAVKDRSARRDTCARQFGRPWKEVSEEIQRRRAEYARKDAEWFAEREQEEEYRKEALKEQRRQKKSA